ncbi:MAG: hypothetical protein NZ772_00295 [Cyanobacteria bacterium]|nr:hypothetical protein [Cyanobacteriota bacterium]MDW8199770.1 hypothetical protein [Cyanobacteriota bacterium SKYGB_h_bin112]
MTQLHHQCQYPRQWNYRAAWYWVIPVGFFTVAILTGYQKGAYWLAARFDPEYIYLLNSLSIANFNAPGYIDHPGTPVHIAGAAVLWLVYLAKSIAASSSGLTSAVLQQPELYLRALNLVLVLLMAGLLGLVGWVAYRCDRQPLPCIALQLTPLLMATTLASAHRVNPEPFLFAVSQGLVLLLLPYLHQENLEKRPWFAVSLGAIVGLGLAAKVTYLPVLLVTVLLPTLRQQGLMLASAIAAFLLCTLPIAHRYGEIMNWLLSIAWHTDNYGYGDPGIVKVGALLPNLGTMLRADPAVFIVLIGAAIAWGILRFYATTTADPASKFQRLSTVLLIIGAVQIAMAIKHPVPLLAGDVELRYLMPTIALSGLLVYAILQWAGLASIRWLGRSCLLMLTLCGCLTVSQSWGSLQASIAHRQDTARLDRQLRDQFPNCLVISHYRSSLLPFALWFGNGYANEIYSQPLAKLYPSHGFYHPWRRTFETFTGKVKNTPDTIRELQAQPCVLLRGSPMSLTEQHRHFPTATLSPVLSTSIEVVYRLK